MPPLPLGFLLPPPLPLGGLAEYPGIELFLFKFVLFDVLVYEVDSVSPAAARLSCRRKERKYAKRNQKSAVMAEIKCIFKAPKTLRNPPNSP